MDKARRYLPAWQLRACALEEERYYALKVIEEQYAVADADRVALFETRAKEKEDEVKSILRQHTPGWIEFVEADPHGKRLGEEPLDRSSIPATPDTLLGHPGGLQTFLALGKGRKLGHRNPTRMPGEGNETGPAVMSLGRATNMLGNLSLQPESNPKKAASDRDASPEPRTELEYRSKSGDPVAADHTPEEQWALFKSGGAFLADVSRLARQYVKLVALNSQTVVGLTSEAETINTQPKSEVGPNVPTAVSSKPSASLSRREWTPNDGAWPPVIETDVEWNGFTNWVIRCREADSNFKSKLMDWSKARIAFKKNVALALKSWVPSQDFVDRTTYEPDPRKHYRQDEPLWVADGKEIGWRFSGS